MLREVEEAVQRNFQVSTDGADTRGVTIDWESRLHISQVWQNHQYNVSCDLFRVHTRAKHV